jgi:very-short-patch-repair endonuclease
MRNARTQRYAKELRYAATDAERHLWYFLRRRNLSGFRFRRQVPIGPYVVDFLCLEASLVIELDGGQHAEAQDYDRRRDDVLRARGLRVLRFWDNHVLQQTDAVLEVVLRELKMPPP